MTHTINIDAVRNLDKECQKLFSKLTSLQKEIRDKLSVYANGKNLKGNEIVGWLGEIYGKLLFNGKLVDDKEEYDFVSASGDLVSVKTRKGRNSGWRQSSAIPKIQGVGCPTHLLFVHLNDDYSLDTIWLFDWKQLVTADRFKKHMVRGSLRSFIFAIDEEGDKDFIVYEKKTNHCSNANLKKVPLIQTNRLGMKEQELIRKLNSVGKTIFVQYFNTFKAYSEGKILKEKCVELLVSKNVSNEAGAAIRSGNAMQIFKLKKECAALIIISESTRLSLDILDLANKLLKEHCRQEVKIA